MNTKVEDNFMTHNLDTGFALRESYVERGLQLALWRDPFSSASLSHRTGKPRLRKRVDEETRIRKPPTDAYEATTLIRARREKISPPSFSLSRVLLHLWERFVIAINGQGGREATHCDSLGRGDMRRAEGMLGIGHVRLDNAGKVGISHAAHLRPEARGNPQ
jgi:hypothetical protein